MTLEELSIKYGVVLGRRYHEQDKLTFLNALSQDFKDLGYESRIAATHVKRIKGINMYVGDLTKADVLIVVPYDTGIDALDDAMIYTPYNPKNTERNLNEASRRKAIVTVAIGLLLMVLIFTFLPLSPMLKFIVQTLVMVCCVSVAYFQLKGRPNVMNVNYRTSGVVTALTLAKAKDERVAFVFTDRTEIDGLGDVMLRQTLPKSLDSKDIIILGTVGGDGEMSAACLDRHHDYALNFVDRKTNIVILDEDTSLPLAYYERAVYLNRCVKFEDSWEIHNVMNRLDINANDASIEDTVKRIKNYLKRA